MMEGTGMIATDGVRTIANAPRLEPDVGREVAVDPARWGSPLRRVVCSCGWSHDAWSPTRSHSRRVAYRHHISAHAGRIADYRFVEG